MKKNIVYLDLFSGTGGFAKGLQEAGYVFDKHYFSETDFNAIANYSYNFQNAIALGNVKKIKYAKIEKPDLITFGSPCQDISIAGKIKGLNGSRSRLFFEAVELLAKFKPSVFIFENVKGLFSSNEGKDFERVLRTFANLGIYDIEWQLLNTNWFLPQNRERIYIVGHLRGQGGEQIFPLQQSDRIFKKGGQKRQTRQYSSSAITVNYHKGVHARGETYIKQIQIPEGTKKGYAIANNGDSINLSYPTSTTKRGRVGKGVANTLTTNSSQHVLNKGAIRKLIPLECERLQGFPDEWTSVGIYQGKKNDISDTQRYIMLGNAVSVPIVKAIGQRLIKLTMKKDKKHSNSEFVLNGPDTSRIVVPEIKVTYNRTTSKSLRKQMSSAFEVAKLLRETFNDGEIEFQEYFVALYLSQDNRVIGYYRHSKGGISGTVADVRIILGVALKCAAVAIILAHNHPSGQTQPSIADKSLTSQFKEAARYLSINILDHVILTKDSFYSFADEGLLGLNGIESFPANYKKYVNTIETDLRNGIKHNKLSVEKIAFSKDIKDRTEIKELTELAIVNVARQIASTNETTHQKFEKIVDLYNHQVNLSHRTSQSILLQQYSTPAPIAYLMGVFCNLDKLNSGKAFEPSAGNGLLTIAGKPKDFVVNEVDFVRNRNLKTQGFSLVTNNDASQPFYSYSKKFTAVLTNPPFGRLDSSVHYGSYKFGILDHVMSLRALDTLSDNGKAAIIISGHSRWDSLGRLQKGKNRFFFNYLYHNYYIKDVIQIDGRYLYTRQGTGVPVRLILISGRKAKPEGAAPLKSPESSKVIKSFDELYGRVMLSVETNPTQNTPQNTSDMNLDVIKRRAEELKKRFGLDPDLGAVYNPASNSRNVLNTQVPDSMSYEVQSALTHIKEEVGGDIDNFVRHRLGFATKNGLFQVLSAEQIDAVAMAIYNIEAKAQGMIIGDQTGIGKGRVAAAMIRYAVKRGLKPIFITEKANLFSDIYRDLVAIGSGHLRPFIINNKEAKTDIKDEDGEVIYEALSPGEQNSIFETGEVPSWCDFVVATYTQFNSPGRKPTKPNYLREIAKGNIMIMDESHNSSGSSNTGTFMQSVVGSTEGVVFLSATFAKRPDNMPIYAMKTSISEANLSKEGLVKAILRGGVALQEILSSQLVAEGQMIRRERSFEGIEVNYVMLDAYETEHRKTSDKITNILRYIIAFQEAYVDKKVKELDKEIAADGKQVAKRGGTSQAGVDNLPYFSKVFNVINQMLFSIKAEAVAQRAIQRLKEGKKPVIAFSSTMGSFIEQMENEEGVPVSDGETIRADFSEVLRKGLDGVLRYTVYDNDGKGSYKQFDPSELGKQGEEDYLRIREEIDRVSTGILISPIDVIIKKLEAAGYSVAEVTGRKFRLELEGEYGTVSARKKFTTNDAFRKFNNNEIDVLMINQSGSTGASAHAIVTNKVSLEEVKQRVMIILQAELDINTEVQKWGRINRTGQVLKPIYDYVTSAIPAEKRLMMMAQMKLKSLDANTTSNQKQSNNILNVPDFLNKYGDKVVGEYLNENPEINKLLDYPLSEGRNSESADGENYMTGGADKVSGRVAVLSTKMQTDFYNEITERYNDYVDYMKQIGEYDLEVEALDLKAEMVESTVLKMGKGGNSAFGEDSFLEKVNANILKKPFRATEVENLINEALNGKTTEQIRDGLLKDLTDDFQSKIDKEIIEINNYYDNLIKLIPQEKKIKKLEEDVDAFLDAMEMRKKELEEQRTEELRMIKSGQSGREQYIRRVFKFFTIGRLLAYPTYAKSNDTTIAICLGVVVDKKRKNSYAKSAVKVRIAIANSNKYVSIPTSRSEDINKIISFSHDLSTPDLGELLTTWEVEIKSRSKDRGTRYIITGNLLQAFDGEEGKLVSYTTINNQIKKGILMPDDWKPGDLGKQRVSVPIIKALKLLKELSLGNSLNSSDNLSFIKIEGGYRIIVPSARSKGGDFYMDQEIWPLIRNNKFEIASDKMQALLPDENIDSLAEILQRKHSVSLELNLNQLSRVDREYSQGVTNRKIELPPPEDVSDESKLRLVKIRAKALALKHKLNIAA